MANIDAYSFAPVDAPRVPFQFWAQPVYQKPDGTLTCPGFVGDTYLTDEPWSYLTLGIPSTQPYTPGKCVVHIHSQRDIDKKKAAGNDGARVAIHGLDARPVEIELLIWTPDQLRALSNLIPILFPMAYKGSPPAYDVQHPMCSLHGVKSVQFIGIEGPEIDNRRIGTFRLHAIEFLKPSTKNVTKTDTGSIGSLFDPTTTSYATPGSNSENTGP